MRGLESQALDAAVAELVQLATLGKRRKNTVAPPAAPYRYHLTLMCYDRALTALVDNLRQRLEHSGARVQIHHPSSASSQASDVSKRGEEHDLATCLLHSLVLVPILSRHTIETLASLQPHSAAAPMRLLKSTFTSIELAMGIGEGAEAPRVAEDAGGSTAPAMLLGLRIAEQLMANEHCLLMPLLVGKTIELGHSLGRGYADFFAGGLPVCSDRVVPALEAKLAKQLQEMNVASSGQSASPKQTVQALLELQGVLLKGVQEDAIQSAAARLVALVVRSASSSRHTGKLSSNASSRRISNEDVLSEEDEEQPVSGRSDGPSSSSQASKGWTLLRAKTLRPGADRVRTVHIEQQGQSAGRSQNRLTAAELSVLPRTSDRRTSGVQLSDRSSEVRVLVSVYWP